MVKKSQKVIKVELTYEDGSRKYIEDLREIDKWNRGIKNQGLFCMTHGIPFPSVKWIIAKP